MKARAAIGIVVMLACASERPAEPTPTADAASQPDARVVIPDARPTGPAPVYDAAVLPADAAVAHADAAAIGRADAAADLRQQSSDASDASAVRTDAAAGPAGEGPQGAWSILEAWDDARNAIGASGRIPRGATLVVTGTACFIQLTDGTHLANGGLNNAGFATCTWNPRAVPAAVDIETAPTGGKIKKFAGIYRVSGDELRLVWNEAGPTRPTDFESAKGANGSAWNMIVCRRAGAL